MPQYSRPLGLLDREHRLKGLGLPSDARWERGADWPDFGLAKEQWLEDGSGVPNAALVSAPRFLPLGTVILSSCAPARIRADIAAALSDANAATDARPGELDTSPKALGAASLPFGSRFTVDT